MFHAKNYLNRPMFHAVISKITLAQSFWDTVYILTTALLLAFMAYPFCHINCNLFCTILASFNKISRTVYEIQTLKNDIGTPMFLVWIIDVTRNTFWPTIRPAVCAENVHRFYEYMPSVVGLYLANARAVCYMRRLRIDWRLRFLHCVVRESLFLYFPCKI